MLRRPAHADIAVAGGDDHVAASEQRGIAGKAAASDDAHHRYRAAQAQLELGVGCRLSLEMGRHDQFAAVADAIKQPDLTPRLFGETPVEHAEHRRDADAASNQHDGRVTMIEVEVPSRCA